MKSAKKWGKWVGILSLLFVLAACGPVEPAEEISESEQTPETRVAQLMREWLNVDVNPLHLSFSTEFENEYLTAELYVKGGMIRMDSRDPELGMVSVITNQEGSFVVLQDHKMYMKTKEDEEELSTANMSFFLSEEELALFTITTGQEELFGIAYDYEKLVNEEEELIYYFLSENGQWGALKSQGTMMFIHSLSSQVSNEPFQIPKDFLDMTGQM